MARHAAVALLLISVVLAPGAQADTATRRNSSAVPNISGQRLDLALAKLKRAGISSSQVHYTARSPQHPFFKKRWRVCAQAPKAGSKLHSDGVLVSIRRVCAAAFKRATQREVPYMRHYNNADDWRSLAKHVCGSYTKFTYATLSKVVAADIRKQPYDGEIDDVIRIAHKTNCPEVKSTRF